MTFLVDTSVWSLALRRNTVSDVPQVEVLKIALLEGDDVATTGMILLELLQGAVPKPVRTSISDAFSALTFIEPQRSDYEAAAGLSNTCRKAGVQLPTVDALIAQLAIGRGLTLLTCDKDFTHAALHIPLSIWNSGIVEW